MRNEANEDKTVSVQLTEAEINALLNPSLAIPSALHRGKTKLMEARKALGWIKI